MQWSMLRLAMLATLVMEYVETCSAIVKLVCGNAFSDLYCLWIWIICKYEMDYIVLFEMDYSVCVV